MRTAILILVFLGLLHHDIAIRHDIDDGEYLAFGEEFPSVVRVGENGGDGTLVASDWIVTAAHVAAGMVRRSGGAFQVFVDGHDAGYDVEQVILHPGFEPMGPNDIALLRLARPVIGISPAPMYRDRQESGKEIVLVGHGDTKRGTGGAWVADRRRRAATNMVDDVNDNHIMFDFDEPKDATRLEGTAGPGDSGGPAFIAVEGSQHLAGVSSLGQPGANGPGTYGAREHYVRVSSHVAWLDSVMSNPPSGKLVNLQSDEQRPGVRRVRPGGGGPGTPPPGVTVLEEIGLLVADRDGRVRMVGRIDELYPAALLDGGIRPPAAIVLLNGEEIASSEDLKRRFDGIEKGGRLELEFDHNGERKRFVISK